MRGALRAGAALLLLTLGCGKPTDPVRAAIEGVAGAAQKRDAEGVGRWLAPGFQAGDGSDRAAVEATLRQYFAAYESLRVDLRKLAIERRGETATARFEADVSGMPRALPGLEGLLPRSSTLRFEIDLRDGPSGWKIDRASWSQL